MSAIKAIIIVAGGKGLRMEVDIPKQFIEVQGKPILMHTITTFYNYDNSMQLILVLPDEYFELWDKLCKKYNFEIKHNIVAGGTTRFNSVLNGIQSVKNANLVAIHDGVRPLVSHHTIRRCFDAAELTEAAIPVTDCMESLRNIVGNKSISVNRNHYKLVQTPQIFEINLLKKAYEQEFTTLFTDDASVVESYFLKTDKDSAKQITLVEGNRENIKITTKFDLIIADAVLKNEL